MADLPDTSHRFRSFVAAGPPALPHLPFVHTGTGKALNEILRARQLCVSRCEVFSGEHLLYLFYGRPAYRPRNDDRTSLELWRALITFVINQAAINHIARIFPFDSGAYAKGRYAPYIGAEFRVEEFQLPSEATIPQKIVGAFFGTNSDYWEGRIRSDCEEELDPLDFHSQVYTNMNSARQSTDFDCRAGIIEVQSADPLPLNSDTLEAIIVPDRLLVHDDVRALARDCNAEMLGYRWRKDRPTERARDIDAVVWDWLRSKGRL